ncbi:anti-repressor SinI family protein [Virgibacillus necropolis]|uniref:anti-repressor SinI family protein n=1 Tax=Virgibacillus necropolis TaxID=163877 RepID=UPI00384D3741
MNSQRLDNKLVKELNSEWLQLMLEAKKEGMSVAEVRAFLQQRINPGFILYKQLEEMEKSDF